MGKLLMRVFTTAHGWIVKTTGWLGGGTEDGSLLVLRHTGARTGKVRETPLMFIHHEDGYVVCASMGGAPENPAWYHNLKANPETEITIDRSSIPVRARELAGNERAGVWSQFTSLDERWEKYASRANRALPLMALEPR